MNSINPLKVFVVGATGFCGTAVCTALQQHPKFHPIAHIRTQSTRPQQKAYFLEQNIEIMQFPWEEMGEKILQIQPNIICSFLGTTQKDMKQYGGDYQSIDYGLNSQLLQISEKLPIPPLWLYLSSSGAQWGKWSSYLKARWMFEKDLALSKCPSIVLRPKLLTGQTRFPQRNSEAKANEILQVLCDFTDALHLNWIGNNIRPLDAPDVAKVVIRLLSQYSQGSQPSQQIFELSQMHQINQS